MSNKKVNWRHLFKKSTIGRRFALAILVFSSVVTLVSTVVQLSIEYQKDINEINTRLEEVRDGYSQSLVHALWITSKESIQLQLDGIIKLPDMQYIEVRSDQNIVLAVAGKKQVTRILSKEYPLIYEYQGKMVTLGTLRIVSTLDGVYARLKSKIIVILLAQGVKTFLVTLFILYLFYILIGRHLDSIANFMLISKELGKEDRLVLDRISTSTTVNDELETVVNAINEMRSGLLDSFLKIQQNEENLSITLYSIGDGVIATDHKGIVTRMNPVAERLTGWTLADALGHPLNEIFDIINAQSRLPVRNPVELVMECGKTVGLANHTILLARDGNEYHIADSAAPIRDSANEIVGVVLVFSDVTEKYRAQAQILRLSQVVEQIPYSTIITDLEGVIEYVNKPAIVMTGYPEDELIGKKMNIFCSGIHPQEFYSDIWHTILHQQKMWRGTIINQMKNGKKLDCSSTIFPIFNANHELINFVAIQEDVTERNVKDKLFIMQTRQAQMGEMLSMIAHQWRQPLAVIGTLLNKERVNLVLNEPNVDELMKNFDDIEAQVQHLSRTISDFRDFFKPDKEMITTKNSIIVTKAVALLEHMLKQKNIMLTQTHSEDGEYETYEHEMMQVILNLVKNAQDAFEEKNINDRKIIIETTQHRGQAIITVEDNAGGISPTVAETLFLPYVTTKNEHNGTGLGLYMSKTIVEDHCKGQLTFQNTISGVKFMIKIPLKGVHD